MPSRHRRAEQTRIRLAQPGWNAYADLVFGGELYAAYQGRLVEIGSRPDDADMADAVRRLRAVRKDVLAETRLDDAEQAALRFTMSSVMINLSAQVDDIDGLNDGVEWATEVLLDGKTPKWLLSQAAFNRANGLNAQFQSLEAKSHEVPTPTANPSYRLEHSTALQQVRVLYRLIGDDESVPDEVRGRALCNLGNVLDDSGRWAEAHVAYVDALAADPTNGNAAGNLAELLRRRIAQRVDQRGHLAAVYDHYVAMARDLRHRTIELAGNEAADRWGSFELTQSAGHLRHEGAEPDSYQQWIVAHRLALVATVEGLGTDSARWDSATVTGVIYRDGQVVPAIHAALNVLKAEYLVARRLAFRGEQMHSESIDQQHPDDPGIYADTGAGAFYGEPAAMLLLAQRSALDVLDKIAVAANEHFGTGLLPKRVEYTTYWTAQKGANLRSQLPPSGAGIRSLLALAELSIDLTEAGMYPDARLLRNAGTHRLVHATTTASTGPTEDTFSTVNIEALKRATIEALWVTRSAFLYFVDLIESQLDPAADDRDVRAVPDQA